MNIAVIKISDLSILGAYVSSQLDQSMFSGDWGNQSITVHVQFPDDSYNVKTLVASVDEEDNYSLSVDSELLNDFQFSQLREQRNAIIAACDYTQMSDTPIDPTCKAAFATYRQALRDLPDNTEDPANPDWPTAPAYVKAT